MDHSQRLITQQGSMLLPTVIAIQSAILFLFLFSFLASYLVALNALERSTRQVARCLATPDSDCSERNHTVGMRTIEELEYAQLLGLREFLRFVPSAQTNCAGVHCISMSIRSESDNRITVTAEYSIQVNYPLNILLNRESLTLSSSASYLNEL